MSTIRNLATVALVGLIATPLSAQVVVRDDSTIAERVEGARRRIERQRTRARIDSTLRSDRRTVDVRTGDRRSSKIPPGHLPPRGMCRVWIEGVPPGHQPPVEGCTEAQIRASGTANARVIYGNDQAFPGKGKGKLKSRDARDDDGLFDDDRFEDDDRVKGAKASKSERKAVKAARKGNKGRR
jgi:hypothetical protein